MFSGLTDSWVLKLRHVSLNEFKDFEEPVDDEIGGSLSCSVALPRPTSEPVQAYVFSPGYTGSKRRADYYMRELLRLGVPSISFEYRNNGTEVAKDYMA